MVGGAGGLGRAVVEALRPHHRLAILDLDEAALARAREQLTDDGDAPQLLVCDVTDPVSIASAFRRVEAALGPVSVLVNVVGIPPTHASAAAIDLEVARRAWDVNVLGAWACMQAVIPGMAAMGWGRIVNVTSVSAVDGWRQRSEYAGSKAALASLTMTAAVEVAADGITVNAVAPGHMR
ncbi:MAG: SDR family NAD(P)-dependent oxidoreductase, partial [Candidatus Velamenicoccus archaeovorus]